MSFVISTWWFVSIMLFLGPHAAWASQDLHTHHPLKSTAVALTGKQALQHHLQAIIKQYNPNNIGIYVKSMRSGDSLYEHNINKSFVPASIMKLLTAESALLILGENYRFKTAIMTDALAPSKGGVRNGKINGNLYFIQSGDPSLTYQNLNKLLHVLKAKRINYVAGNLYIDDSAFDHSYFWPRLGKTRHSLLLRSSNQCKYY